MRGNSIRSTERITGIDRTTIMRLLVPGEKCERLMSARIQNVRAEHLELDEGWSYIGCRQKRVQPEMDEPYLKGDQYTFSALESSTKLVMVWELGKRDAHRIEKIRQAVSVDHRFDVSTDGFEPMKGLSIACSSTAPASK